MGWKNIKEHFRIGHIVSVCDDGAIAIGSAYVSELLLIRCDGELIWGELGERGNKDLARYHREMSADPEKVRELLKAPDSFSASIPVYVYEGGKILEKLCEAPGWPNVTHDGQLMYDNHYSTDKAEVVKWAKENAAAGILLGCRRLKNMEAQVEEARCDLAACEAEVALLEREFPSLPTTANGA